MAYDKSRISFSGRFATLWFSLVVQPVAAIRATANATDIMAFLGNTGRECFSCWLPEFPEQVLEQEQEFEHLLQRLPQPE